MKRKKQPEKSGAALVIALGFLAVLVIMILAFSAQTRSERLAGRAYLSNAQTRHLLQTALTRAMQDIDQTFVTNYPARHFALGSESDSGSSVADTIDFSTEYDYLPLGNDTIRSAFFSARDAAKWKDIQTVGGTNVGRIAYIVVNTSGLLDANSVGGNSVRRTGTSPGEIQLDPEILPELGSSSSLVASDGSITPSPNATRPLVHNRDTAWRRFESLRDLYQLNDGTHGNVISSDIESFSTISHTLTNTDFRTFMGTNEATVNNAIQFIERELDEIGTVDTDYVLNQLFDYLDEDTIPQKWNGNAEVYTDESVEPVPLVNELALTFNFTIVAEENEEFIEEQEDEEPQISVTVSNDYKVEVETWYPFIGYTNNLEYTLIITDPIEAGTIDPDLIAELDSWGSQWIIPAEGTMPEGDPSPFTFAKGSNVIEGIESEDDLVAMFESLGSDIVFPEIYIEDAEGNMVDRVFDLELPMEDFIQAELIDYIKSVSSNLFSGTILTASNSFTVGLACIDPRLNHKGPDLNQWQDESSMGITETIGEINEGAVNSVDTPDIREKIYIRNTDRIDSPWEFTHILYDQSQPWKTFQMLEINDPDGTRRILEKLSPYPNGPPVAGRINPYTPHTNVIASAFMDMPTAEFTEDDYRFDSAEAQRAARIFMNHIKRFKWTNDRAECTTRRTVNQVKNLIGSNDPRETESYFRNAFELFDPRDSSYAILLVAQSGTDLDQDGFLIDDEVRGTEQAIAYVWRDIPTGKSAVVFYGLTETLRSTIGTESWGTILNDFNPD